MINCFATYGNPFTDTTFLPKAEKATNLLKLIPDFVAFFFMVSYSFSVTRRVINLVFFIRFSFRESNIFTEGLGDFSQQATKCITFSKLANSKELLLGFGALILDLYTWKNMKEGYWKRKKVLVWWYTC